MLIKGKFATAVSYASVIEEAARKQISGDDYVKSMEGIYTTCVGTNTLDEAPMAYKSIDAIMSDMCETVDVIDVLKPIYNFKASE